MCWYRRRLEPPAPAFPLFPPSALTFVRGGAQLERVAMFPETGSDAGQATLNSSAGFIVSEVDRVRATLLLLLLLPSLLLNTRTLLASDMEQTNPCHAL